MLRSLIQCMKRLRLMLLLPGGWLYGVIMQARNFLYDQGIRKSYTFDRTVLSVGNLTIGGTGKTPCIEYLVHLLQPQLATAMLSRGYKRITQGVKIATPHDTALTIGDEPLQVYNKFSANPSVKVAVAEDRVQGINQLLAIDPTIDVILLDDAFQHRSIQPCLNILLTDFNRPFFTDYVLPAGRLRESRKAAQRADVVIVTKCPNAMPQATQAYFSHQIYRYCRQHPLPPIFFTRIGYGSPVQVGQGHPMPLAKHVLLVTGIADSKPLAQHVAQHYHLVQHMAFQDHHAFTPQDIRKILAAFSQIPYQAKCLLTTEKDSVRLRDPALQPLLQHIPIFYLPIAMAFIAGGEIFNKLIFEAIRQH